MDMRTLEIIYMFKLADCYQILSGNLQSLLDGQAYSLNCMTEIIKQKLILK